MKIYFCELNETYYFEEKGYLPAEFEDGAWWYILGKNLSECEFICEVD